MPAAGAGIHQSQGSCIPYHLNMPKTTPPVCVGCVLPASGSRFLALWHSSKMIMAPSPSSRPFSQSTTWKYRSMILSCACGLNKGDGLQGSGQSGEKQRGSSHIRAWGKCGQSKRSTCGHNTEAPPARLPATWMHKAVRNWCNTHLP